MQKIHNIIIDIGNSRVKYYLDFKFFDNLSDLENNLIKPSRINVFFVASVQNYIASILNQIKFPINKILIFEHKEQNIIKNLYPNFGNDRAAKLIGASKLFPKQKIILFDFGTATTINILDDALNFVDGFILLGFRASLRALADYCSALPDLNQQLDLSDFTSSAIFRGQLLAYKAQIKALVDHAFKLNPGAISIASGGDAEFFLDYFDHHVLEIDLLREVINCYSWDS